MFTIYRHIRVHAEGENRNLKSLFPVQKMSPGFFHRLSVKGGHERTARRLLRFLEQSHARFLGQSIALSCYCNECMKSRHSPKKSFPRGHAESHDPCSILWKEVLSAILAPEFVTLQKILAIELHFLHEHTVIGTQNQNTGNNDSLTDCMNHAGTANRFKVFAMSKPRRTVEHSKTSVFGKDNLSMIEGKQTEGPFDALHSTACQGG